MKPAKAPPKVKNTAKTTPQAGDKKKKKKDWKKKKFRKKKPPAKEPERPKAKPVAPPVDAQEFSANWKKLQEILKASEVEKKQPVVEKKQPVVEKKQPMLEKKQLVVQKKQPTVQKQQNGVRQDGKAAQKPPAKQADAEVKAAKKGNKAEAGVRAPKDLTVNRKGSELAQKRKKEVGNATSAKKPKVAPPPPLVKESKVTEDDIWFDDVDPDDLEATVGVEAADIMRKRQGIHSCSSQDPESVLVKERAFEGLTRVVAMDCEMVGVGEGGEDSILARVSLVNHFGKCIYDKFVKPTERVTDFRTAVSGIRLADIKRGEDVRTVQREVAEILKGRIVVGHAIHNDLKILLLDHPKKKIRDTQKYKPFKEAVKSGRPSLKLLCKEILHVKVQQGEHSSVQDAQAAMRLYTMAKKQWEAEIKASRKNKDSGGKKERKPKTPRVLASSKGAS